MRVFRHKNGAFALGEKTLLMGILNLTPDSFFAASRAENTQNAAEAALRLQSEGADLIDVGACSTRPGGEVASEEEELRRIKTLLPAVLTAVNVPVSVDTFRPAVAREALSLGAAVVNDVSGAFNPETARLVKETGAGYIVMHAGPEGAATADRVDYPLGIVNEVQGFFDEMLEKLVGAGIDPSQLCFDPGFGFAKDVEQNAELLRGLKLLDASGCALLAGLSRKRFVGALSGAPAPEERLPGTVAADVAAVLAGADILRVHYVAAHVPAIRIADSIK